jgi:phosphatidylglycerophosphatase A
MDLKEITINKLKDKGVTIEEMANMVLELQLTYNPSLTFETCYNAIDNVLAKREVIHAVLTGIAIDEAVANDTFDKEIAEIIKKDEPLYGLDEILALSIVNIYGSIALTNFGYLDKLKPGLIGIIDKNGKSNCATYLDDIVSAIIAAAVSRIAHK